MRDRPVSASTRSPARAVPAAPPRRGLAAALLAAARPAQWTKNAAVLAALVFALRADDPASVARALLAAAIFCALSSATYAWNDVVDRDRDRLHPLKRHRPIASGELPVGVAVAAALALGAGALVGAVALGASFAACALAYALLQVLYSAWLKRVVILDVFCIAAGFVLRVVAGAEAIAVPVSNWLYLCTMLLALFLALGKRRAELVLLAEGAEGHRDILALYSTALLDQLLTIVSACTVLAYALYTLAPETIEKFHGDGLKYTIPFVLFGLFRYLFLVHRRGEGGQPERVLLRDRALQLDVLAWLVVVAVSIYGR